VVSVGAVAVNPGVRHHVQPPAQIFADTDVLAWAEVPASARFTGRLHLDSGGKRVGRVPHLAICSQRNEQGLLLVHCDESWKPVGLQAWNAPGVARIMTVEAMKTEAERFYEGLMSSWQAMPSESKLPES
jgi:hypothetical protein